MGEGLGSDLRAHLDDAHAGVVKYDVAQKGDKFQCLMGEIFMYRSCIRLRSELTEDTQEDFPPIVIEVKGQLLVLRNKIERGMMTFEISTLSHLPRAESNSDGI